MLKNLIKSPDERKARSLEKRYQVLRFLREEIYTTREVIELLLGLGLTGAKQTLHAMEREGLIRHQQVECPNGWRPTLWGITSDGQAMAFNDGEEPLDRVFSPAKVGLTVVRHTIFLQIARIKAEREGWKNWIAGDRVAQWEKDQARPDAIAEAPNGKKFAVEVELTMKTKKRYESVLFDRLMQVASKKYEGVIWLLEDEDRAMRLEKIIKSIDRFTREHNGKKHEVVIEPRHHKLIHFTSFGEWPNGQKLNDFLEGN